MRSIEHHPHADTAFLAEHMLQHGPIGAYMLVVAAAVYGAADDHLSAGSCEGHTAYHATAYQRMQVLALLVGATPQHEPHHTLQPQLGHHSRRHRQRRLLRHRHETAVRRVTCAALRGHGPCRRCRGCYRHGLPRPCHDGLRGFLRRGLRGFELFTCRCFRRCLNSLLGLTWHCCLYFGHCCHCLNSLHCCKIYYIKQIEQRCLSAIPSVVHLGRRVCQPERRGYCAPLLRSRRRCPPDCNAKVLQIKIGAMGAKQLRTRQGVWHLHATADRWRKWEDDTKNRVRNYF